MLKDDFMPQLNFIAEGRPDIFSKMEHLLTTRPLSVNGWTKILSIGSVEEEISSGPLDRLISTQWTIFLGTPERVSVRSEFRRHRSFAKQNS